MRATLFLIGRLAWLVPFVPVPLLADQPATRGRIEQLIEFLAVDDAGVQCAAADNLADLGPEAKSAAGALIPLLASAQPRPGVGPYSSSGVSGAAANAL